MSDSFWFQSFFAANNFASMSCSSDVIEVLRARIAGPWNVTVSNSSLRLLEDCNNSERGNKVGGPEDNGRPRRTRPSRARSRRVLTFCSSSDKQAISSASRERLDPVWRGGECEDVGRLWEKGLERLGGEWWMMDEGDRERPVCFIEVEKSLLDWWSSEQFLDHRGPPGTRDGPETLSARTLADRWAVISSIWAVRTASVFSSAARKAACLSVTVWALYVRPSTFLPNGLWEMGSLPPEEQQPWVTQKQVGIEKCRGKPEHLEEKRRKTVIIYER